MTGAHDRDQLVFEEWLEAQLLIASDRAGDRKIESAVQQRLDWPAGRFGDDAHFYAREFAIERFEYRRQPVIARVAFGADSQDAVAVQRNLANVFFSALQLFQHRRR